MKRNFGKKLVTITASAAMLATLLSGTISAGTQTAQAQENDVAVASEQADITAPVIESVALDKQGQTLGDDDTFNISIKAYDLGSGIEDVTVTLKQQNKTITPRSESYSYLDGSLKLNEETNCYEGTIKISDTDFISGKLYVQNVKVTDKAGNYKEAEVASAANIGESNAYYWVNIQRNDNENPKLTSIEIEENTQTVKPGDVVHIKVGATDNSALKETCTVNFSTRIDGVLRTRSIDLKLDAASGCYTGTWTIIDSIQSGKWSLGSISLSDVTGNSVKLSDNTFSNYYVNVQGKDSENENEKNAPKINSISIDKAGQTLKAGDVVKFTVDVTDDTKVSNITIMLRGAYGDSSSSENQRPVYLFASNNIEGTSKYEGTYTIRDNDYPCEWYVTSVIASDIYNNSTAIYNEPSDDGKGVSLECNNYYNVMKDGTFVQSEVAVSFNYLNSEMKWETKTINVPKRTQISKLAEKFTPDVKFEGVEFLGWNDPTSYNVDVILKGGSFEAVYSSNVVEKIINVSMGDGSPAYKTAYSNISFVKNGEKVELPTQMPGLKNINWTSMDAKKLIDNGYIIKTDSGKYTLRANAEVDNSTVDDDNNKGDNKGDNTGDNTSGDNKGDNNQTTDEGIKLPAEKIQETVTEISTADAGTSYTVDMKDATVAPKDVLEAAKGKDVDIVFDMDGYKWTINGKNIKADTLKDINLAVNTNSDAIPSDIVAELAGNNPVKQISLAYNGDFGFQASLSYNIGSEYAGKYGNLYYYDSTGRMVFQNAGVIDKDGNVSLTFSHASEYAVVISDVAATGEVVDTPTATGDNAPIAIYIILCVMGIAVAGLMVVTRKKTA